MGVLVAALLAGCSTDEPRDQATLSSALDAVEVSAPPTVRLETDGGYASASSPLAASITSSALPAVVEHDPAYTATLRANAPSRVAPPRPPSSTELLLAHARTLAPETPLRVLITLRDEVGLPHGWKASSLRGASAQDRASFVAQRRAAVAPVQKPVIDKLTALGATDIATLWVTSGIAATVAAGSVAEVTAWSEVEAVGLDYEVESSANEKGWSGDEPHGVVSGAPIYLDLREAYAAGITGERGGTSALGDTRVMVAIVEGLLPIRRHFAWLDKAPSGSCAQDADCAGVEECIGGKCGLNRYEWSFSCREGGCREGCRFVDSHYDPGLPTHSTIVSWVVGADSFEGQLSPDPTYRGTGVAREATMFATAVKTCEDWAYAMQCIIAHGPDVLNVSISPDLDEAPICSLRGCEGLNDLFREAVDAGIVVVNAAGNSGADGETCTLDYPSSLTSTLTVGALNSNYQLRYDLHQLADYSSTGPVPTRTFDGDPVTTAGIDLVAPGGWNSYPVASPDRMSSHLDYLERVDGTSFAAPFVAGLVALLKNAFWQLEWPLDDARILMVNALLFGDRRNRGGVFDDEIPRGEGVSTKYGFGRAYFVWPSSASLTPPWGWGWRRFVIHQDEVVRFTVQDPGPEHEAATHHKWAVLWEEPDLEAVADIDIEIHDTCEGGGGDLMLEWDHGSDLRKGLHTYRIAGRCLEMRVIGTRVPEGGRVVYSADFWHSSEDLRPF